MFENHLSCNATCRALRNMAKSVCVQSYGSHGGSVNKAAQIVLAFLLVATSARAGAQTIKSAKSSSGPRTAATSEIGKFMGELYRRGQFNGSVLVADREGIIYRGAFGLANRSSNVAFTPDTPSCLASLSKP